MLEGEDAFTPDAMEVRRVDGAAALRLEPMSPAWNEAFEVGPGAHQVLGDRLRSIVDTAITLEACPDHVAGPTAYCIETSDPEVAALGEMLVPTIDTMHKETLLSDLGAEIVIEPAELGTDG